MTDSQLEKLERLINTRVSDLQNQIAAVAQENTRSASVISGQISALEGLIKRLIDEKQTYHPEDAK